MSTETKFVGIKEFRQKMAEFAKTARKQNHKIVVMSRNKPLFEVNPFTDEQDLSVLVADIAAARHDIARGRIYSQEQILAELAKK